MLKYHVLTGLIGVTVLIGGAMLADPEMTPQQLFPCQEDELLGYSPKFGPDNVGCIHYEEGLE